MESLASSLKESPTNWGFHILGTSGKNSFCDTTTHTVFENCQKMSQLNFEMAKISLFETDFFCKIRIQNVMNLVKQT